MTTRRVLLLVFGILLMIVGAVFYMLVELGSHGNYSLIPRRTDDWFTLLIIASPVLLGAAMIFRSRR